MSDLTALAERIAREAHLTQTDRADYPYILHVERVVQNLHDRFADVTEHEIAAAWLHDVIEDTAWTADALHQVSIPEAVTAIVREVSRPEGLTYRQWIRQLAETGSRSAVRVKIADNMDNSSPDRVAAIPEGAEMLKTRYQPARTLLEERLKR